MEEGQVTSKGRSRTGLNGASRAAKKQNPSASKVTDGEAPIASGAVRAQHLREDLGAIVGAIVDLPRYRHLPISQISDLFFAPLRAGRISVARVSRGEDTKNSASVAGFVTWASVSEQVSDKIAEQIKAGVFPIRLTRAEWASGNEIWLLDVVAASKKVATAVVAGVIRSFDERKVRIHPLVGKLVDSDYLNQSMESQSNASAKADV